MALSFFGLSCVRSLARRSLSLPTAPWWRRLRIPFFGGMGWNRDQLASRKMSVWPQATNHPMKYTDQKFREAMCRVEVLDRAIMALAQTRPVSLDENDPLTLQYQRDMHRLIDEHAAALFELRELIEL
jgi:hypothetical protein